MKKLSSFGLVLLILIAISCASTGHLTSTEVKPDEAIVAGKVRVLYNGKDVTSESGILFNTLMIAKYPYKFDESGFFVTKLPIGKNSIRRLSYRNLHQNFNDGYAFFEITSIGKIHYIGDITFKWSGPKNKFSPGGLLFALGNELDSDGKLEVTVDSLPVPTVKYFVSKFNERKKFTISLLKIDPRRLLDSQKTDKDYSFAIILDDDTKLIGEVKKTKKDKIYLAKGHDLYVIRTKRIKKIYEYGKAVLFDELTRRDFGRLHYGRHPNTIQIR